MSPLRAMLASPSNHPKAEGDINVARTGDACIAFESPKAEGAVAVALQPPEAAY